MQLPYAEPYKIKMVEPLYRSTREEREQWIKECGYNVFNLRSEKVFIDLLTDSGTGAMSAAQWAAIMTGDESYAGASSFYKLKDTITQILGMPFLLPTHQGRAAENVLFSALIGQDGNGKIIPGNSHFDTTKGHIEARKATALDCTIDEAFDTSAQHDFKGNLDLNKLEDVFKNNPLENIPLCLITVTNNSAGGQPVSLQNIKDVAALCKKYGIRLFFDAARFAENAFFIKQREEAYKTWSIKKIVKEMFSYVEGCTMSAKKDGIVNIGGFITMRDQELYEKCITYNIQYEGYITYGGMAGRDLAALAQGLDESTEFDFLEARIGQVKYLGDKLIEYGIPVQTPLGGHAIFIDANKFLPHIPKEEFRAQTLAVELYIEGGVRATEIGTLLADRDPVTRENRYPKLELLRLAIPRRAYTNNHFDYVAAAIKNVWERRNEIKNGLEIIKEAPIMRHFTVQLDRKK